MKDTNTDHSVSVSASSSQASESTPGDARGRTGRALDERMMRRALVLAARGVGRVSPNPPVGAVVVRDGEIIGEGFHREFGGPHGEIVALNAAGELARGATLYNTLEPCNHHGKTPPCVDAIIAAGISRVVYAVGDPNVIAAGGAGRLAEHGIDVSSGVESAAAMELMAPFLFAARGASRPWVTLKLALSIDGAVVDASRQRGWLSGPLALKAVHALRGGVDAVAVGIGTVLTDDPMLTVRLAKSPRTPPLRVVFDRAARTPLDSKLVKSARNSPVVVVADGRAPSREAALKERGVEIVRAHAMDGALLALRARGVQHLLVEGGPVVASALMVAETVDRLVILQAPVILGRDALPAFSGVPPQRAEAAPRLKVIGRRVLGPDVMTTYAVSGD